MLSRHGKSSLKAVKTDKRRRNVETVCRMFRSALARARFNRGLVQGIFVGGHSQTFSSWKDASEIAVGERLCANPTEF